MDVGGHTELLLRTGALLRSAPVAGARIVMGAIFVRLTSVLAVVLPLVALVIGLIAAGCGPPSRGDFIPRLAPHPETDAGLFFNGCPAEMKTMGSPLVGIANTFDVATRRLDDDSKSTHEENNQ
jgi:hypothetical protein